MSLSAAAMALHFPNAPARPADLLDRRQRQALLAGMARWTGQLVAAGSIPYSEAVAASMHCCAMLGLSCEAHAERVADLIDQAASAADLDAQRRIVAAALPLIERRAQSVEILATARQANADAIPDAEVVAIVKEQISAVNAADRRRNALRA